MNKNLLKNPKLYITIVLFGIISSMLIFDFSQIERMSISLATLGALLVMTLTSYVNLLIKLHKLEEAVYYADYITHFTSSEKIENLEKIGIYGTEQALREAKKHFSDIENKSIIAELKQL